MFVVVQACGSIWSTLLTWSSRLRLACRHDTPRGRSEMTMATENDDPRSNPSVAFGDRPTEVAPPVSLRERRWAAWASVWGHFSSWSA